jgi:hypothetical protein
LPQPPVGERHQLGTNYTERPGAQRVQHALRGASHSTKGRQTPIGHDDRGGALLRQTMGLLVQIVDKADSLISDIENGPRTDEVSARRETLELRAATTGSARSCTPSRCFLCS